MHLKILMTFIVFLFFSVGEAGTPLKRLDPHGAYDSQLKTMSLDRHAECKVCHEKKGKHLELKPNMQRRCILCHNGFPHSGVVEHLGRNLGRLKAGLQGEVECLSCHHPHRAVMDNAEIKKNERREQSHLNEIQGVPSFLKIEKDQRKIPEGLIERSNAQVRLKRVCTDCHTWGRNK